MTEARTSRPPHTDRSFGSVADATGGFVDAVRCSSATHGVDASASLADGLCVSQTTYSQHGADVSACLMSMERSSKMDGARPTRSVAGQLGASSLENAPDLGKTQAVYAAGATMALNPIVCRHSSARIHEPPLAGSATASRQACGSAWSSRSLCRCVWRSRGRLAGLNTCRASPH